jgi:alanyl-tRNA synthetase
MALTTPYFGRKHAGRPLGEVDQSTCATYNIPSAMLINCGRSLAPRMVTAHHSFVSTRFSPVEAKFANNGNGASVKAKEIRSRFLEFFAAKGHEVVASSSLVPQDDPTLIFTNAGMNQFKSVFLGLEKRDYVRAASVQKCMRVSGKHNDLEEVGKDARHHTLFEMLGNWSFGDYYKEESIAWGWELLTEVFGLDASRLWVSIYKDDDESFAIWTEKLGFPKERLVRLGDLDKGDDENFWSMADTGPCGPCTEIHYDQGEARKCDHADGCAVGVCDCDRWLELWNHVFMEFDRAEDGTLIPLPMKSVDTGLGFERLVAVMQGKISNYDTDLFTPLVAKAAELSGKEPVGEDKISMQVIADHARAVLFTITDGAMPSNEGRGYVVRRILRRAARHGHLLGLVEPFLWKVSELVIDEMADAYPELLERKDRVLATIRKEEERFGRTLTAGLAVYGEFKDKMKAEGRSVLSGEEAFKLHDTFGFPVDLTAVVAEEDGFTVDHDGFAVCMGKQRAQSGSDRVFKAGIGVWQQLNDKIDLAGYTNLFTGYENLQDTGTVVAVRSGGQDENGHDFSQILVDRTPFYGTSGGQVGDIGTLTLEPGSHILEVIATEKSSEGNVLVVTGSVEEIFDKLKTADSVFMDVDAANRRDVKRHHTATHLLHATLREVLGDHVEQAGSEVTAGRLRFDFRHDEGTKAEEIKRIEAIVQQKIMADMPVQSHAEVPLQEARDMGAMALFGEKYGDRVRVVEIVPDGHLAAGDEVGPSIELCGGTHCGATGEIGPFRILSESSVSAGVRRIEAVAGEAALAEFKADQAQLSALALLLRPDGGSYADQVQVLLDDRQELRKELARLQQDSARASLAGALDSPREVAGFKVISALAPSSDKAAFMQLGDHVRDRLGENGVVILGAELEGKATLLVTLTADLVAGKKLHAGNLVKAIATAVGGRGGGRPNMAQAGLPDLEALQKALDVVDSVLDQQ